MLTIYNMLEFVKNIRLKKVIRDLMSAPREKKIDNIEEVRTIGVVCSLDNEQNWNILHHFAKVMENRGKEVYFVALLPKEQELDFVVTHQHTYICRAKTDFNFWGLPTDESLEPFTCRSYDLLIDTFGDDNFFAKYVMLKTTASLRAGYVPMGTDDTELLDFAIRGDGILDLKYLFNNVIEYLGMIKK